MKLSMLEFVAITLAFLVISSPAFAGPFSNWGFKRPAPQPPTTQKFYSNADIDLNRYPVELNIRGSYSNFLQGGVGGNLQLKDYSTIIKLLAIGFSGADLGYLIAQANVAEGDSITVNARCTDYFYTFYALSNDIFYVSQLCQVVYLETKIPQQPAQQVINAPTQYNYVAPAQYNYVAPAQADYVAPAQNYSQPAADVYVPQTRANTRGGRDW